MQSRLCIDLLVPLWWIQCISYFFSSFSQFLSSLPFLHAFSHFSSLFSYNSSNSFRPFPPLDYILYSTRGSRNFICRVTPRNWIIVAKPPPGCCEGTNIFKWLILLEDLYRTCTRQNGFSSLCYKDKMTVSTDVGRCFCGQLTAETERQEGREEIRVTASCSCYWILLLT